MCLEKLNLTESELAVWVGAAITFLAILVALFKEELQRLWRRAVLDLSVKTQPPDCHISMTTYRDPTTGTLLAEGNCYYLRLWVQNNGNSPATNVQVFATKLLRETTPKKPLEVGNFLPMNLTWAHTKEIFRSRIAPKMGRHCDLGHIADPKLRHIHNETRPDVPQDKTVLFLDLEVAPFTLVHLLQPGNYELRLIIAADNLRPIKKVVKIVHSGNWFDDEKDMFEKGVKLSIE
ncbi:MAG TPA: hypothetical protein VEM15_15340 [Thermodesulfobacteriota bacterium]|nr:hypothetical protein [Thermodesulfobacteriota bacterium]